MAINERIHFEILYRVGAGSDLFGAARVEEEITGSRAEEIAV